MARGKFEASRLITSIVLQYRASEGGRAKSGSVTASSDPIELEVQSSGNKALGSKYVFNTYALKF